MDRRCIRALPVLLVVIAAHVSRAQEGADDTLRRVLSAHADTSQHVVLRTVVNEAFGVGERLVFDVNYGFITAGEAVLEIPATDTIEGRACYRVEFHVNSAPSFSWIYRVEDRYVTYIDEQTIAPWKFEQHVREGGFRMDNLAQFDQRRNIATTAQGTYRIPPYVHDILSAFYYARTFDYGPMKPGDTIELHNFYKDTTYDLVVKFLGRQQIEVAAGTFNTVVIEPLVRQGGLIKSEGRIVIWLSDDERKIPVRVSTKVIIGSIDTELRQYSGTRGEVRARVK